jgi:hypothetical protein
MPIRMECSAVFDGSVLPTEQTGPSCCMRRPITEYATAARISCLPAGSRVIEKKATAYHI